MGQFPDKYSIGLGDVPNVDATNPANIIQDSTHRFTDDTSISKLGGIEAAADVTDAVNVGTSIHGAAAKVTPVDADEVPLIDSADSNLLKRITWANVKAALKTYLDGLYVKLTFSSLFAYQHTASSVTGTVDETALATFTVPGGSIGPNGVLEIVSLFTVTNSTNAKTLRIKFGGTTLQTISISASGTIACQVVTLIRNRNSASSQVYWPSISYSSSGTAAVLTAAIDTTADQSVVITGQLANTGELVRLESVFVKIHK